MQAIRIVPNDPKQVISLGGRIRCGFELINNLACSLWDCCLKVTMGNQVARFDIPELNHHGSLVKVDFDSAPLGCGRWSMLCQLFQGDRLVAVYEHYVRIIDDGGNQ